MSRPLWEECFGSLGCSEASSNLADEQVGETVPGPTWLYPRHVDAVRPLRTQGAHNIRTRGSLPQQRSHIRTWLSIVHHRFSACKSGGVHIRIYACSRDPASCHAKLSLQTRVGPYMREIERRSQAHPSDAQTSPMVSCVPSPAHAS